MVGGRSEAVASLNYPSYAIVCVSGRHVVVGGGGGAAKTGIMNQFDVFELYHDGRQTAGERVVSHDVGEHCITNMAAWPHTPPKGKGSSSSSSSSSGFTLAVGLEDHCATMRLTPATRSTKEPEPTPAKEKAPKSGLRKRRGSERNAEEGTTVQEEGAKGKRRPSLNTTLRGHTYFSFDVEKLSNTQTVTKKKSKSGKSEEDEPYQKCCRVSPDHKTLVTGGTDGRLRVWALPAMTPVRDIQAHEKEVDDIDFKPDGRQLVSVSKPTRECCVWSLKDGKKVIQVALQSNGVKYKCFRARYGIVEGDVSKSRLFTISNPVSGSKNPAVVAKWCGKTYSQERSQTLVGSLSSLALSDDGRFLATGTMSGTVYILVAFSLQKLRVVEEAHSMFVTGLEWLPTHDPDSMMVRGYTDASLLSISCDNSLKIHHIPKPGMVPVWVVAVLAVVVLFCSFLLAGYLGL